MNGLEGQRACDESGWQLVSCGLILIHSSTSLVRHRTFLPMRSGFGNAGSLARRFTLEGDRLMIRSRPFRDSRVSTGTDALVGDI